MALRVLCTGDIHIGRRSSKVPETYRTANAWNAIVDRAISEQVDLLAISGDVIDQESKSYESLGPLHDGLRRLDGAGIETVAVAGNHDYDVLPAVAEIAGTSRYRLIGKGGTWERYTLTRDGSPCLHIDGWSFPQMHVLESPMRSYKARADDGVPVIGLLHADVGVFQSRYAPVVLEQLWAQRVNLWLLGHIHAPGMFTSPDGRVAFYPGSPFAMDPGEPGAHGVWLLDIVPDLPLVPTLTTLSPVRYDFVTVDLTGVADEAGFLEALAGALSATGQSAIADDDGNVLEVVSCRVRLTGRSPVHQDVYGWMERARSEMESFPVGRVSIQIERFIHDVRPVTDLNRLASGNDPVAETARLLIALDAPELDEPYARLVARTVDDLLSVYNHSGYASVRASEQPEKVGGPREDDARQLLAEQGWRLLSTLIAQRKDHA